MLLKIIRDEKTPGVLYWVLLAQDSWLGFGGAGSPNAAAQATAPETQFLGSCVPELDGV